MVPAMRRLLPLCLILACTGRLDVGAPPADPTGLFQPASVSSSLGKIKTLLVGLPPTDAELAAVSANPAALRGLVQQWLATPQASAKLQGFFGNAFQQTQVQAADFADQLGGTAQGRVDARLLANLRESFPRTVLELMAEKRPFTETLSTQRFMLTPRLAAMYAFMDAMQIDDQGRTTDLFAKANPAFQVTLTAKTQVPLSETLDPKSPNFMVFYAPQLAGAAYDAACPQDPIVYKTATGMPQISLVVFLTLHGVPSAFNVGTAPNLHRCQPPNFPAASVPITVADSQQWTLTTVRPPAAGEATTSPWDLLNFRATKELVLRTPRVGFFTTPAFLAEWNTNNSNQARVTANQTLIVALGHAMSPENASLPPSTAAVDQTHAAPGTTCYACHQSLDPMRQFFRQTYSYYFHPQTTPAQQALPGQFGFRGSTSSGKNIFDLASALAGHPDYASAWAQKLCTWANSARCDETDPEFQRVTGVFVSSRYDFSALLVELLSSPLVSYLKPTQTTDGNQVFPVSRRDHLCATLSARLGMTDVCGLDVNTAVPKALLQVQLVASVLPSDAYSRGGEEPVLANDPNLFFRTGMEIVCSTLATQLIDNGVNPRWSSTQPDQSINDFVHQLMGIGSDNDVTPKQLLRGHFDAAVAGGAKAVDALRSTFTVACLSPSVVGIGQ